MDYLTGDKALMKKLKALKTTEARKAIRKGTRAGAKIGQGEAKAEAPRSSGELRRSIKVRSIKRSRKYQGHIVRLAIRYGSFVELGARHITARHFLKNALTAKKQEASSTALDIMKAEIEASMKKLL